MIYQFKTGQVTMGRLPHGADLLESILKVCTDRKITLASIQLIGAVQKAVIGYYDQKIFQYEQLVFRDGMEILGCHGNISLKDGRIDPHLHILLGDRQGRVFGGHLLTGTLIFSVEFGIQELQGAPLIRGFDSTTRLPLWEVGQ